MKRKRDTRYEFSNCRKSRKTKTISKYLSGDYIVRASVGHIRDLPKSNKKAIDIPAGFVPYYEIIRGKEKIVEEIKELSKKRRK